ncbi:MAG: GNAT family N-acetyltransferase, partial [Candidatus Heimdallarchaeaceae archaeon]
MLKFRKIKMDDWGQYHKIDEEAFPNHTTSVEDFKRRIENEGFFGGFLGDTLIGFMTLRVMEKYGHIGKFAIKEEERRKGYGRDLMEYALKFFKQKKVEEVGLYVLTDNEIAINLYEKYCFKKIFEAWHYLIERELLEEIEKTIRVNNNIELKVLKINSYKEIIETFPEINKQELKKHLEKAKKNGYKISIPLGLYEKKKLKIYARFNPEFSGSRPFLCTDVS